MSSLRKIKKDIDYLVSELVNDCYLCMFFHPEKEQEMVGIMSKAVDWRNSLYERVNNPAEKNNRSLVRKHYGQIRRDMFSGIDQLFGELSEKCKPN